MGRIKQKYEVKNKLAYLRAELGTTVRDVEKYTGISNTSISFLENERRFFRQEHLDVLCDLFQVSHDYLLGNSNTGIYLYDNDNNKYVISEMEYLSYKPNIKISFVDYPNNEKCFDDDLRYHSKGYFKRTLTSNENEKKSLVKNKLIKIIDTLGIRELEKITNIIEELFINP